MKKLNTALLSLSLVASSGMAVTYTLGDVFSGISKAVSSATAPSDGSSSSVSSSAPAGVLVKDLPGLPKLSDKPFLRGLSKIDYAEISNDSNFDGAGHLRWMQENRSAMIKYQEDAVSGKLFTRTKKIAGFSNPYANDTKAFDLSSLNEITRIMRKPIYTYMLKTHFKIPDEFVKNGKFVFESETPGVMTYSRKGNFWNTSSNMVCYEMLNGNILDDKKSTYIVKKGNIVDYQTTCYFGGHNGDKNEDDMIKSINPFNEALPSSWKVYSVPDPLAKDAGKSYTITNRDMFLYENEVYPAKQ